MKKLLLWKLLWNLFFMNTSFFNKKGWFLVVWNFVWKVCWKAFAYKTCLKVLKFQLKILFLAFLNYFQRQSLNFPLILPPEKLQYFSTIKSSKSNYIFIHNNSGLSIQKKKMKHNEMKKRRKKSLQLPKTNTNPCDGTYEPPLFFWKWKYWKWMRWK